MAEPNLLEEEDAYSSSRNEEMTSNLSGPASSDIDSSTAAGTSSEQSKCSRFRNFSGFWLLGLTNNFSYVIMLSAAHDILKEQGNTNKTIYSNVTTAEPLNFTMPTDVPFSTPAFTLQPNHTPLIPNCNKISTGAILLADIFPALIIKLTAPFYMQAIPYWFRVAFLITLPSLASFLIVALSPAIWVSILGVVCASIGSGFGEITFLALSSHFHKNVVSAWSSGTGGAGVFGALAYAGLTSIHVSPRNTLFIMLVIPVALAVSYYFLVEKPLTVDYNWFMRCRKADEGNAPLLTEADASLPSIPSMEKGKRLPLKLKVILIRPLLKWMIPLSLVYLAEYFINQGLTELLVFPNEWLSLREQYTWYQVIYQLGVFISRSSVNFIQISKLWILPILQFLNIVLLMFQIFYRFIPSIWIVFFIILYEGLLGGAAYVNTFYKISEGVPIEHREFSIGVATVGDSIGIMAAGFIAIPVHNLLCSL